MTTVREATIDVLRRHGMTTVFGNPGSTELPMFRGFPDDFRYVLGLQESVVVAMADGYAQASGTAAVVNLHSAVGVGHGLGNLFTAFRNRSPLLVIAGQQARSMLTGEPFLFAEQPTEFPRPYVKFAREPARAADVPATVQRAIQVALNPPCGPVFVSVPVDDWDQPTEPVAKHAVYGATAADPDALRSVADRLAAATHPAFVVGAQVDRDGAFNDVVALAERHAAAVFAAPLSARCGFPERHPLFAGFLPAAREGIAASLAEHDLVLVLGAPVFSYHVEGSGPVVPTGSELIQLTDDPDQAAWTPVGASLVTNLRHAVRALLTGAPPVARTAPPIKPPVERIRAGGDVIPVELLMRSLAELRPPDSIVVEEAPSARSAMHEHLPFDRPASFFTCASGGLGHGLPAAVGVTLARGNDRRVIALVGDGSAMYASQALWTAAQLDRPLTIVVINNQRYAALDDFARHFGLDKTVGTTLPGLDFVALAAGHGVPASRVTAPAELPGALAEALTSPGPYVLDVAVA